MDEIIVMSARRYIHRLGSKIGLVEFYTPLLIFIVGIYEDSDGEWKACLPKSRMDARRYRYLVTSLVLLER